MSQHSDYEISRSYLIASLSFVKPICLTKWMGRDKTMNTSSYLELKKKSLNTNPQHFAQSLEFDEIINIACNMLHNEEWDNDLQKYAIQVLEALRKRSPNQWNATWRYDAILGYAYDVILDYDNRYIAYKRAYDNANLPPPELLVALARCCWAPGEPPITEAEAISLAKRAVETVPYIEALELLRGLYKSVGNTKEQTHCENDLKVAMEIGKHLPDFFTQL